MRGGKSRSQRWTRRRAVGEKRRSRHPVNILEREKKQRGEKEAKTGRVRRDTESGGSLNLGCGQGGGRQGGGITKPDGTRNVHTARRKGVELLKGGGRSNVGRGVGGAPRRKGRGRSGKRGPNRTKIWEGDKRLRLIHFWSW